MIWFRSRQEASGVATDQSPVRLADVSPAGWRPAIRFGLQAWAVSRIAFLGYGFALAALFRAARPPIAPELALWPVTLYARYDTGHFLHIATFGYPVAPFRPPVMTGDNDHAFLPGYPIGARWLADLLTGGSPGRGAFLISLAVLAWLGAAASAVLIWRLAADETDRPTADRTVLVLLAGPYSVFLVTSYSEGVFLAFALAAWLAARRDRWWLAGLMAAGAAIVRVNGLFLVAGLAVMFVLAAGASGRRIVRSDALSLALPVLATAGYFGWMRATTGRWTTWFEVQDRGWARTTTWPWTTFVRSARRLLTVDPWPVRYQDWLEMVFAGLLVLGVVVLLRRRRWPEFTYVGLTTLSLLTSSYYVSIPRSMLVCFPLIVLAAEWTRQSRRRGLVTVCIAVSLALLVFNTTTLLFDQWTG
jgi:Mannosyltransferase (PIG-V)